jgi:hypothetical protein
MNEVKQLLELEYLTSINYGKLTLANISDVYRGKKKWQVHSDFAKEKTSLLFEELDDAVAKFEQLRKICRVS